MSIVARAGDVAASAREEYLVDTVTRILGPIHMHVDEDRQVPDRVMSGDVGSLRVGELHCTRPGAAERTARDVRRSETELCKVDVYARGSGVIGQDGREARLQPGDLAFVDLSRPSRWSNSSDAEIVAVAFPRSALPLPVDDLADLTAVRIPGGRGAAALASGLARQLVVHVDDYSAVEGTRLATTAIDLLTVALAARLDRAEDVPAATQQHAVLQQIHRYVEERLADPRLSPAAIASAHHMSLRSLYKLFETQPTSVAGWIRERRLERCRRDLLDPSLRDRPVSAIAARWGLTNPTHFSRAFRDAYGLSPVEYRLMGHA